VTSRSNLVLNSTLHLLRPAVRLMLRHGVTYTAFSQALKRVFLQAAQEELKAQGMPQTDSAVSVLSGVHRRDVRNLTRLASPDDAPEAFAGLASQVVARWLSDDAYLETTLGAELAPRTIARSGDAPSFDALVQAVSQDVRPRAVLDDLQRLGLVQDDNGQITLLTQGFVPKLGFSEMAAQLQNNLQDHLSAACQNLDSGGEFLEQAVFVDEITAESALHLHKVSAQAWKVAFQSVMRQAQKRFDADAKSAPRVQRTHRARMGMYFFSTPDATSGKTGHDTPD
jgi:Family of unknown function (DUF6502)